MSPRTIFFSFCLGLTAIGSDAIAQQQRDRIHTSLDRIADASARVEATFCDIDLVRGLQGAVDAINAMPERSAETPLQIEPMNMEMFGTRYGALLESADDVDAIERAAINGLIQAYDPTGDWRTWADVPRRLRDGGLLMTVVADGAAARVSAVEAGGPAAEAGILVGDRIVEIDGHSTEGMALGEVEWRLSGDINRSAAVVVYRDGALIDFYMSRVDSRRSPAPWRIERGVAIITMTAFPQGAAEALRVSIRDIRRQPHAPSAYVLDLRGNQGGVLDDVNEVADTFIGGGLISTIRPYSTCHGERATPYEAHGRDETRGARLFVLINGETASGAELVAAALRERRQATLVGQPSHGAARVHTVTPMTGGRDGFLKLSTGVMTSPSGTTWDQTGLTPDMVTEPAVNEADPAMQRAISLLAPTP